MSITEATKETIEWAKDKKQWIFFFLVLALLMVASFGVGYMLAKDQNPAPIIIEKANE